MKKFAVLLVALFGFFVVSSTTAKADVGEVMGGSHLPLARFYSPSASSYNSSRYAEDEGVMSTAKDPVTAAYRSQYSYQYSYDYSPVYYGYYDWYGYWHNYTDDYGYPMYYWNGSYYYY